MNAPTSPQALSLQQVRQPPAGDVTVVNMFSTQGFALAQRIAQAYMTSNAVPAAFRAVTTKREKQGNDYVDVEIPNPAAMGNCLVAIETAQAVGMSIVAVMQNANVIEGQLRWSGKFIIAAINASRRFTPLRFHTIDHGLITAKYKEKGQWNRDQRRFDMIEREAQVNNLECVAWALPAGMTFPQGVHTLDQAKAAGLPVIESAPVSMKMAVEEGWYSKPGSKWQGEMKHLMLQYRAGSFFGNIHAPDIVMGMGGQSAEEAQDVLDAKIKGGVMQVDVENLRNTAAQATQAQRATVTPKDPQVTDVASKEVPAAGATQADASNAQQLQDVDVDQLEARLRGAQDLDMLDADADLIRDVLDDGARQRLEGIYQERRQALAEPPAAAAAPRNATRRRMAAPE